MLSSMVEMSGKSDTTAEAAFLCFDRLFLGVVVFYTTSLFNFRIRKSASSGPCPSSGLIASA